MSVTTYEGFIENGQIRLPENVHLPEKTKVYIVVPEVSVRPAAQIVSPRLAHREQIYDFRKEVLTEGNHADV
jgi:hypothetical protein